MHTKLCYLLILVTLVGSRDLFGQLELRFEEDNQSTHIGESVEFIGTVVNQGDQDLFVNASTIAFLGDWSGVDVTKHDFYPFIPTPLTAGQSWGSIRITAIIEPAAGTKDLWGIIHLFGGNDEHQYELLCSADLTIQIIPNPLLGDLDFDQDIDLIDFSIFVSHWREHSCNQGNTWCDNADFDYSGDIGLSDLSLLAEHWLEDFYHLEITY